MIEYKTTFCMVCVGIAFLSIFVGLLGLMDGRTQSAENKVIIEQLCNLDETSYWCRRIK